MYMYGSSAPIRGAPPYTCTCIYTPVVQSVLLNTEPGEAASRGGLEGRDKERALLLPAPDADATGRYLEQGRWHSSD